MNKLILSMFLLSAINIQAQIPDYFANNPQWRVDAMCAVPAPCIENDEYVYYINGDSTIGNHIYKKYTVEVSLFQTG